MSEVLALQGESAAIQLPFHIHIIGPKQSGKSHFAKLLAARLHGVLIAETSGFLMEEGALLLTQMFPDWSMDLDTTRNYLSDKAKRRFCLAALGDFMTALHPDCLIKGALSGAAILSGAIVVGTRRKIEMEAWFVNQYRGYKHTDDVLIEIVDKVNDDNHYELAGWNHRQAGALKYFAHTETRAGWSGLADVIAAEILEML